jgi:hypothetical protein
MAIAQSQVRSLARAIANGIALADLDSEEVAPGRIVHTDLPWTVPGLQVGAQLAGAEVQDFLDAPLSVDPVKLAAFWHKTLYDLWHTPGTQLRKGYILNTCQFRLWRQGQRMLRFAMPPGSDDMQLELTTGLQLSMEVAHTAYISLPVRHFVRTDDDYFVELANGQEFGVRAGRPIIESPWQYDGRGQMYDLAEMPRGPTSYACQHDQIAHVRSLIYVHKERFKANFEGLDVALQAMRFLTNNTPCPDLLPQVRRAPVTTQLDKERERILWDAISVMESSMADRAKLIALESLLVPTVMSLSKFRRAIFSSPRYPFTMTIQKHDAVLNTVRQLYETEVPCSLKRNQ